MVFTRFQQLEGQHICHEICLMLWQQNDLWKVTISTRETCVHISDVYYRVVNNREQYVSCLLHLKFGQFECKRKKFRFWNNLEILITQLRIINQILPHYFIYMYTQFYPLSLFFFQIGCCTYSWKADMPVYKSINERTIKIGVVMPPWQTQTMIVVHLHPEIPLTTGRDFVSLLHNHAPRIHWYYINK